MTNNKNAAISQMILGYMSAGLDIQAAYDAVFGEGAYIKMAGEIYDALHAKSA